MNKVSVDVAVVGGGAAGLTAAAKAAELGCRTLVIERSEQAGGVLLQCIHSGFGLHYFKEELTGPEYAERVFEKAVQAGAEVMLESSVMQFQKEDDGTITLTLYSKVFGVTLVSAKAVILAMGCRERCRGNIAVPGDRVAGVLNAGLAQQLLNLEGMLPGRKAVIVGSGDIGLIMARRLSWCGVKVECVIEIMPYPAGLSRNIAQCLEDFHIPLYLAHGVTGIHGKTRVEAVTFAPLVDGKPDLARERKIECDTVLFSVGLVPENELSKACGIKLNPLTGGAAVDGTMMTSVPGIFSCGNVLHVHDLVDFVSEEAERAAFSAVRFVRGEAAAPAAVPVKAGAGVRYTVPSQIDAAVGNHFFMRSRNVMDAATLRAVNEAGEVVFQKVLRYVKPAEMISVELPPVTARELAFTLEER